ncbi:MAG: hypothetical protein AABZ53_03275 [Planctomycetota bacterium]
MNSGIDLLRMLSGGDGRAAATGALGRSPLTQGGVGGASFAELLGKARDGQVHSELPVQVSPGSGIDLSPEQLERLAQIADRAEASGASRVLVNIDDTWVRLDVGVRQVTGAAELTPGEIVGGIDAVVTAPPAPGTQSAGTIGVPNATLGMNSSLIDALERAAIGG